MIMAGGWRLAKSLDVLRDEIEARAPGTTVWTIGDQAHASGPSDHNPTSAGVVCAIDVLGDRGLDLADFAARVVAAKHPAFKYLIFNRRIWNAAYPGWRKYTGSNPHSTHAHVSVGTGPDGRSTGPVDDITPWRLWPSPRPEEDLVPITPADRTAIVRELLDTRIPSNTAGWPDPPPRVQDLLKQGLAARWEAEGIRELVESAQSGERDAAAVVDEIARRLGPAPAISTADEPR